MRLGPRKISEPSGTLDGITVRGLEVTRLEAFSDCIFAFAVTLLVVSLEPPRSFDDLMRFVKSAPGFGVCFFLLLQIWDQHNSFFRKYGLTDMRTRFLNGLLLFVVLLYVYPLKFLFQGLFDMMVWHESKLFDLNGSQIRTLFLVFGSGFFCLEAIFARLHFHALSMADELNLSERERFETLGKTRAHLWTMGVALASCLLAVLLPPNLAGISGYAYFLMGPARGFHEMALARKRRSLGYSVAGNVG